MTPPPSNPQEVRTYLQYMEAVPLSSPQLTSLMDEVLSLGLPFRFQARGDSMAPFIKDGDLISISPLAGRTPKIGEIVAFRRLEGKKPEVSHLVVHRVIQITKKGCILLGDNQLVGESEGPITNEQIIGTVSRIERRGSVVQIGLGNERYAIGIGLRLGILRPALRLASVLRRRFLKIA